MQGESGRGATGRVHPTPPLPRTLLFMRSRMRWIPVAGSLVGRDQINDRVDDLSQRLAGVDLDSG